MLASPVPTHAEVVAALREPGFHGGADVRHIETHVSDVFLAGDRVLKLKKPVKLPFADLSTLERRRLMCHEELRLNRRLAPDVYLGVRAIVPRGRELVLAGADADGAVEYAVEMRRLDERDSLAARIERGVASVDDVRLVARRLAEFHAGAKRVAPAEAIDALRRSSEETFDTLRAIAPSTMGRMVEDGARFARVHLDTHAAELEARARAGRFVNGHGDLRAEHVFIERGSVRVIDCAELHPRLHRLDVGADLSFLVMDLERRGVPALARELVAAYREAGGAPGSDALVAFYAAQRAWIRAKVALIRAGELAYGAPEAGAKAAEARDYGALARRFEWRARGPIALVVCGGAATGKSTLAAELARVSGFPVVGSDHVRKSLAGLSPTERGGAELYGDALNASTYAELARRAVAVLGRDAGVIVDATYRRAADRDALRASLGPGRRVVFVECRAPAAAVAERARARAATPEHVSDAGVAVALRHRTEFEHFDPAERAEHLVVTTTESPPDLARRVENAIAPA